MSTRYTPAMQDLIDAAYAAVKAPIPGSAEDRQLLNEARLELTAALIGLREEEIAETAQA